jgi:hypothetical protein
VQKLEGARLAPKQALQLLNRYFTEPNARRECTVLLIDELDQLTSAKNTIMYELFNWPMSRHARLAVITIANTMDLPERMMSQKVSRYVPLHWKASRYSRVTAHVESQHVRFFLAFLRSYLRGTDTCPIRHRPTVASACTG